MKLELFLKVANQIDGSCVDIYRMEAPKAAEIPDPLYTAGYKDTGYYFHDNSPEGKLHGPFGAIGTALHCWMTMVEDEAEVIKLSTGGDELQEAMQELNEVIRDKFGDSPSNKEVKFSTLGLTSEQAGWLTTLMKVVPDNRLEKPLIPDMFKDLMVGIEKATLPRDRRKCDGTIIVRARQLRWMTNEVLDTLADYNLVSRTDYEAGGNVFDVYKALLSTYVGKRVSPADIAGRVLSCEFDVD